MFKLPYSFGSSFCALNLSAMVCDVCAEMPTPATGPGLADSLRIRSKPDTIQIIRFMEERGYANCQRVNCLHILVVFTRGPRKTPKKLGLGGRALNCEAEQSNKGVVRTPQGTD